MHTQQQFGRRKHRRKPTPVQRLRNHPATHRDALSHDARPHEVLRQRAVAVFEGHQAAQQHTRGGSRACVDEAAVARRLRSGRLVKPPSAPPEEPRLLRA